MISNLHSNLDVFNPVYLHEMQGAELQNRLDFKYIFRAELLDVILDELRGSYRVLEIDGVRRQHYVTRYFDTSELSLYLAHHNQHGSRVKVRIRHYTSNNLCFAEVKSKLNTGRTVKKRYPVESISSALPPEVLNGVGGKNGIDHAQLQPGVLISFDRITLVANSGGERLTLDLNLKMEEQDNVEALPKLVIAELKLYRKDNSVFGRVMQQHRIRNWGVSKYCLAVSLLKKHIRKNNFKPIHTYLHKLQNNSLNGTRSV